MNAIELSPDLPQAHLLLGQSYFYQKNPDFVEATRNFQRVVSLRPEWGEGYLCLGAAQQEQGQLHEAVVSFEKASILAPKDARPLISLGVCFTRLGNYAAAIIRLRSAISLKPHYGLASAHFFLADALRHNSQIEDACEEWRIILRLPSGYPDRDLHKDAQRLLNEYGGLAGSDNWDEELWHCAAQPKNGGSDRGNGQWADQARAPERSKNQCCDQRA